MPNSDTEMPGCWIAVAVVAVLAVAGMIYLGVG